MTLRAPFPAFGGKSRAVPLVWPRFGHVVNYVEPFAFSAAMLLGCPEKQRPRIETINDVNGFVSNFWRATKADPEGVAAMVDFPVVENDLHARHKWLIAQATSLRERLDADPEFFDAKVAGWWAWGACAWIGSGWCDEQHILSGSAPSRQLIHASTAGTGLHSPVTRAKLREVFSALGDRLRNVRVACGDWARVCTPSVTHGHGLTAVFLDPPYDGYEGLYSVAADSMERVSAKVRAWAIENGTRPDMRIALAGYEGEHELPGWDCVAWKAAGGYGNQTDGENTNAKRERIWFSPHCVKNAEPRQRSLFDAA